MYVIGGFDGTRYLNDVWKSLDGQNWTQVTASAAFSARNAHSSEVFDSDIYVIGGGTGGSPNVSNDVWKSLDGGATWKNVHAAP